MHSQTPLNLLLFVLIHVFVINNAEKCPEIFLRYTGKHTYCLPPNTGCNILKRGVSVDDIRTILKEHNRYRSNLAMGKETIGQLPKASNMLQMEWDNELAAVAQKHAEQCKFEHDCNECRQTMNFEVGQNLYVRYHTEKMNKPSWKPAIKSWYDEVSNFDKSIIPSFDMAKGKGVIGHFTQVAWGETWKVGCGYVLYKDDNMYRELYTCNYGPAGNILSTPMYEKGDPCKACPINSCCGDTCKQAEYPGLCKLLEENIAPKYKKDTKGKLLFNCDFSDKKCSNEFDIKGTNRWEVFQTLGDNYFAIILHGGETSTLHIKNPMKSNTASCFSIRYRKGPNVSGNPATITAVESFTLTESGYNIQTALNENTASFYQFGMNLNWVNLDFTVSFVLSVPPGSPDQYFEIKDITFTQGSC